VTYVSNLPLHCRAATFATLLPLYKNRHIAAVDVDNRVHFNCKAEASRLRALVPDFGEPSVCVCV